MNHLAVMILYRVRVLVLFVSMNKRVAQHLRNPASAGPHQGLSYKEGERETHH